MDFKGRLTILNEVDKALTLIEGLRKNQHEVERLGITPTSVFELETMAQELKNSDTKVEETRRKLTLHVRENNQRVAEMKTRMLTLRRIIKSNYEQSQWNNFGVKDKR